MKQKLIDYIENSKQQMLADLKALIEIPSVRGEAEEGKPFGKEPYKALCTALEMAKEAGFSVKNYDGYAGAVDYNDNETELAVFAHLDVVEAGGGWNTDPYKMIEKDGVLYGRGVSDDKGPAIAALYALKALKAAGIKLKKNVRLVLGTDEECGSSDLEYYFTKEKAPKWSFTPDAEFPVTNGEKGRFSKHFFSEYPEPESGRSIKSIKGGTVGNAVPLFCTAEINGIDDASLKESAKIFEEKTGTQFTAENGVITCTGTSAHASLPHLGNNPITAMLSFLASLDFDCTESFKKIRALSVMFPHGDWSGRAFGVESEDKLGKLTISLDIINMEGGKICGYFDSRTPMCATEQNCAVKIRDIMASYGFTVENTKMTKAHYVDENSSFIKTLLNNYEDFTGEKGECLCTGGGTYVHEIDGGVAFGAVRKGLNTNMHGANEFMYVEDILTAAKIFAAVIADVCGVKNE
ncbi:MAG: Sapep family Mn(2+)-dependent dipeptidase [Clostridia bacterium]|nr:Sapep family Mn(2+)-dependent dipeptidase [Clostridia bacterium]